MSQTHIKTLQGWLPDVRKEATVSSGLKIFLTQLSQVEDPDELKSMVNAAAKEYVTIGAALTENTPYKTGTAAGGATGT